MKFDWIKIICNAAVVGGIVGISTYVAGGSQGIDLKAASVAALLAGILAFLNELHKYTQPVAENTVNSNTGKKIKKTITRHLVLFA